MRHQFSRTSFSSAVHRACIKFFSAVPVESVADLVCNEVSSQIFAEKACEFRKCSADRLMIQVHTCTFVCARMYVHVCAYTRARVCLRVCAGVCEIGCLYRSGCLSKYTQARLVSVHWCGVLLLDTYFCYRRFAVGMEEMCL